MVEFDAASMAVSSALLCLSSPVFNRMLQSGMKEAQQKSIRVDVATRQDFNMFYGLLMPGEWSPDKITQTNVDALLAISDYYQVSFIKKCCEQRLLEMPATMARLLQAHRHGLEKQCKRCIDCLAAQFSEEDLAELCKAAPALLLQASCAMRQEVLKRKRRLDQIQPEMKKAKTFLTEVQKVSNGLASCTSSLTLPSSTGALYHHRMEGSLPREKGEELKNLQSTLQHLLRGIMSLARLD